MSEIEVRGALGRQSLHPSITTEQVSALVDRFYNRVLASEQLGPIFEHHIGADWDRHLDKMKSFWRSVLLKSGEYKGKPVPVHLRIGEIETAHFEEWLSLFAKTTAEIFHEEAAPLVNEAAGRIATSLWLSRSSDPFVSPPDWQMHKTVG